MSDDSGSEERSLPPSDKKLREARKKGQVSRSADMIAGASLAAMLLYLWLTLPDLVMRLEAAMMRVEEASPQPFRAAVGTIGTLMFDAVMPYLAKGAVVLVLTSLIVNVAITKGIVFSLDPIKPRADHLHPVNGLKRIFGLKNLVELVKSVIKTVLLVTVCILSLRFALNTIVRTPGCGLSCLAPVLAAVVAPLLAAAIAVLLAGGLIDVAVQRGLFLRQMRMTRSEMKRERRDQDGMPEIRSAQRQQRQSLAQGGGRFGIESATLLIEGDDVVVGLRYVPGETQVPRLVCKGRSVRAQNLAETAVALGIPRFRDPDLAAGIDRRIAQDHFITEEFFKPVAAALRAAVSA
jgi:type III secretion protein U